MSIYHYAIAVVLSSGLIGVVWAQGEVKCRNVSPKVQTFTNIFVQKILTSFPRNLTEQFTQRDLTAEEANEVYTGLVDDINDEVGSEPGEGDLYSKILADAVEKNIQKINPGVLIQNYAKNIGQAIEVLGTLTDDNAQELGLAFFEANRKRIEATMTGSEGKIQLKSIALGLEDFLKQEMDFSKETVPIFATMLAQEWYTLQ